MANNVTRGRRMVEKWRRVTNNSDVKKKHSSMLLIEPKNKLYMRKSQGSHLQRIMFLHAGTNHWKTFNSNKWMVFIVLTGKGTFTETETAYKAVLTDWPLSSMTAASSSPACMQTHKKLLAVNQMEFWNSTGMRGIYVDHCNHCKYSWAAKMMESIGTGHENLEMNIWFLCPKSKLWDFLSSKSLR